MEHLIAKEIYELALNKGFRGAPDKVSELQKWIREKHEKHIKVDFAFIKESDVYHLKWNVQIDRIKYVKHKPIELFMTEFIYDSYEEALEKGIQEALKLI